MKTKEVWNPHTYMDTSPILAAVDLFPVQPQSNSQQDLSQDYRPASVSSRLLSFIQRLSLRRRKREIFFIYKRALVKPSHHSARTSYLLISEALHSHSSFFII